MGEDGACLFRAVADQLYGDEEMHQCVRAQCMDYIVSHLSLLAPLLHQPYSNSEWVWTVDTFATKDSLKFLKFRSAC